MTKEDLFDATIGKVMCLCNKHEKITYIPTVCGRELDVKVVMCKRCAKEISRTKIHTR